MIDLRSDLVWEAMARHIWAELADQLDLKSCEQGNYLQLPAADDLDTVLPFVVVEAHDSPGQAFPGHSAVGLRHKVYIHFVRKISDTETCDRVTRAGRDAIANLYAQPPFDGATALPGYTPTDRANVFSRSAPTLRILDTFMEVELPIGHGVVELDVEIHYYDT